MNNIVIKVDKVSKSYKDVRAVKELSFMIRKSTCFALLGPNGAGKTTMMKMLYGVAHRDKDMQGKISIYGYDPLHNELKIKFISGIVPQENNLDAELSVIQNLFVYAKFYGLKKKSMKKRIEYLLDFMELSGKKDVRIKELSGGMKRRLIIARALINNPKILILDEPTTGLDPQVRHLIWDKLRTLKNEGVTILLTTHYMEEAYQLCDNLIIMHLGQRILEGAPEELIKSNIENYVLEIYEKEKKQVLTHRNDVRKEITPNRLLLYSDSFSRLEEISGEYTAGEFYLRQSNLEDVFLKITGRNLND